MLDWNDLRYLVAVADQGSTLAAGETLRVSQTTVARRISALETALAGSLFYRRQSGYTLTPLGETLLPEGRAVASAVAAFTNAAQTHKRAIDGIVSVTATELYGVTVLPPILQALSAAHPEIHIELDMSDAPRDLATGEADIALRVGPVRESPGLRIRRVANDRWAVYCSQDYGRAHGFPTTIEAMRGRPFIGGGGGGIWDQYGHWLRSHGLEDAVTIHFGNPVGLLAAIRSGVGLSVLPMIVGESVPELVRCLPPSRDIRPVWVVIHERSRDNPTIRTVADFLAEQITRLPGG